MLFLGNDFEIVKWVACMAKWGLSFHKSVRCVMGCVAKPRSDIVMDQTLHMLVITNNY